LLECRSYEGASPGIALIRDGNGTRSIEILVRHRNGAMAEFTRAVRTLQMLQAGKGERNARAAILPAPKEPKEARNPGSLVSPTALVAMPPARAAADRTPPCRSRRLPRRSGPPSSSSAPVPSAQARINPRTGLQSWS
jgi:hypothetical protein